MPDNKEAKLFSPFSSTNSQIDVATVAAAENTDLVLASPDYLCLQTGNFTLTMAMTIMWGSVK